MLNSKKKWCFNEHNQSEDLINNLLLARGIQTVEEKEKFLHPSLQDLTDPGKLSDIEKAKQRIIDAIEQDELIIVYGDYDADGVTSTALLMNVLIDIGANCDYFIPNRFTDGYGLNKSAIKKLADQGAALIITVDNGIANVEEAKYIKELGLDLIITDHHEAQEELPDALAIVHPKLSENYPFKELAGVGVAFQLAHYLLDEMPTHLLSFAAIGTVADLVPLKGDNRILIYYGLKALQLDENAGIAALKKSADIDDSKIITERDIGFAIGPRLNAVGRLENASIAVELLLTINNEEAAQIADKIEKLNTERKQIVETIVKEAKERVNDQDNIIMLYDENWHEGVLGIAASRLVNQFDRPVILLTYKTSSQELKGSGRSIPAFHLFNAGMQFKHLFKQFGGHSQAAGMTLQLDHFDEIKAALNQLISEQLTEEDFRQEISNIEKAGITELTETFVDQVHKLAPFGNGNEEPCFHIKGIPDQVRQIGQHNQHLKLQFKEQDSILDVIGFQIGEKAFFISDGAAVQVVGKLQINEWNGNKTVQIVAEDIAIDEHQLFDFRSKSNPKYFIPFMNQYKKQLLIGYNESHLNELAANDNVQVLTYDSTSEAIDDIDLLYVHDLPTDLRKLEEVIALTNPANIHVSYGVIEDAFLQSMPARDEFKWVYGYLLKFQPLVLKAEMIKMLQIKKWRKEKLIFILKVFFDLEFVYVKDDIMYVNKDTAKRDLTESKTYQDRMEQSDVEQLLYYSTYDELKIWFMEKLDQTREEVIHGF